MKNSVKKKLMLMTAKAMGAADSKGNGRSLRSTDGNVHSICRNNNNKEEE